MITEILHLGQDVVGVRHIGSSLGFDQRGREVVVEVPDQGRRADFVLCRYVPKRLAFD